MAVEEGRGAWWRSGRVLIPVGTGLGLLALLTAIFVVSRGGATPGLSIAGLGEPLTSASPSASSSPPSPSPSASDPSDAPESESTPSTSPSPTPTIVAGSPVAPPSPTPTPTPTPTPSTPGRMNPAGFTLVGSVEVDRYHLYDGETTTIEVKVCNTNSEHPVVYWVEYVDTFGIFVSGRHGGAGSVGDSNDAPMRYEDVPVGECRGRTWTWDPATDNSYHVKDGIFQVQGSFVGKDPDVPSGSGGIGEIDPVYIEVHDGPRPAGAEPPPPTGFPPPEWSLHISTDADSYAPGDTVAIRVEWCNQTDVEQEYSDSSLSDYEFDVMIFLRHDDGSIDEVAWLDTNQRNGTGTGEYQYLQPGDCMGDTVFWRGTAGGFKGDGASDGATLEPGSYVLKAFKAPGPYGTYTRSREAETSMRLAAA